MEKPLAHLTIEEAAQGLESGKFSSSELTKSCLEQIKKYDEKINSYIRVEEELASKQALESDQRRDSGQTKGKLDGIPYNLKDVFATKDSPTTASSLILENWVAPYNATIYQKLSDAGAVLLGKTNTDEFTMGSSTETSYYGVTKNPWDTERVAGGSSGGPAASLAAQMAIFSIGTDTGGSIRQPAAFCGVTGLRPTYGRVSRFGELAMASSLDQTGTLTKTVKDAAIILEVIAGKDPLDATSSPETVPSYYQNLSVLAEKPLLGMKIGVPQEYFGEGVDPEVEKQVREGIGVLERQGAQIQEVSLPTAHYSLAAYYILCPAEVSSNMARYDGIRYGYSYERETALVAKSLYEVYAKSRAQGFGAEVKRRIMLGTHVLSSGYYDAYYKKAERARAAVAAEFAQIFTQVDVLATPVSPHLPFKIGENINNPLAMYKEDILTVPLNIAGIAGMSLPCGLTRDLPVGLQLMSARFKEGNLFRVGAAFQETTEHHRQLPLLIRNP